MKHQGSKKAVADMLKHVGKRKPVAKPDAPNDKIRAAQMARRGLRGAAPKVAVPDNELTEVNTTPAEEIGE